MSSPPLAHALWMWTAATARGTPWALSVLTAGECASLLLIFRGCTQDCPLLAVDVGLGGWSYNIKQNIVTLFVLAMVCVGLCWLRSASTEGSLKRFRMRISRAFPNSSNHDGKNFKTVLRAALPPTLSYSSWLLYRRGKVAGHASSWVGSFSSFFLLAGLRLFLGSTLCMQSDEASWKTRLDLVTVWTRTCHYCGQGVRGSGSLWEIWSLTNPLHYLGKT